MASDRQWFGGNYSNQVPDDLDGFFTLRKSHPLQQEFFAGKRIEKTETISRAPALLRWMPSFLLSERFPIIQKFTYNYISQFFFDFHILFLYSYFTSLGYCELSEAIYITTMDCFVNITSFHFLAMTNFLLALLLFHLCYFHIFISLPFSIKST